MVFTIKKISDISGFEFKQSICIFSCSRLPYVNELIIANRAKKKMKHINKTQIWSLSTKVNKIS